MTPKVSFIVSAFDRPRHLSCVLASLACQTVREIEVLVVDNQPRDFGPVMNEDSVQWMQHRWSDSRFEYARPGLRHCYESSEWGAQRVCGEWLCFPSDDNYYVPAFVEIMLKAASDSTGGNGENGGRAGFVYCDMVYDPRLHGTYSVVEVKPCVNHIDKGGFLLRRELFLEVGGFPDKENGITCDGQLIEELVKRGVRGVKAPGVLWVHN